MTKGKSTKPKAPVFGPQTKKAFKRQQRRRRAVARNFAPKVLKQRAVDAMYKGLNTCALAIALPESYPAIRLPTVDMPRSSTVTLRDTLSISTPGHEIEINGFDPGTLLYAHFGQPGRLALYTKSIGSDLVYKAKFNNLYQTWSSTWQLMKTATIGTVEIDEPWPYVGSIHVSGEMIHGNTLPYGSTGGTSYMLINQDDLITFGTVGFGTASGSVSLIIYKWDAPGATPTLAVQHTHYFVSGAGTSTHTFPAAGYYSIVASRVTATAGTIPVGAGISINVTTTASPIRPRWANVTMGDLDPLNAGDTNMAESVRVNASTFLMTNTSSALNKQGTVIAARIREHLPFGQTPTTLGRMAEKYVNEAAYGVYSFKEFDSTAEKFGNYASDGHLSFDLDYSGYYHFVSITNPSETANVYSVSLDTTLEFKTDIARYAKSITTMQHGELIEARRLLNSNPHWFYENPLHMKQIYGFVKQLAKRAATGARMVAPYALTAASALDPQRAPLYQALRQLQL